MTSALTSGTKQQGPSSRDEQQETPNYWEKIIRRHAKDLQHLPVPPKHFVRREQRAARSRKEKGTDGPDCVKTSLRGLLRGDNEHEEISDRDNECFRWVMKSMKDTPPETMRGVPTITVTTPEGRTCWLKDLNSYITTNMAHAITEHATKQHGGPDIEAHCAAFEEAYRKGLDEKPLGHRPEILFCIECWNKQAKIEEEELRVAFEETQMTEEFAMIKIA